LPLAFCLKPITFVPQQTEKQGTDVDIIILVSDPEPDTTEYLLSTEANQRQLSEAIDRIENKENLVTITVKEWREKYSI